MSGSDIYHYPEESQAAYWNHWMLQHVLPVLKLHQVNTIFEVGCGNGSVTHLAKEGYEVVAIDPSESGIDLARKLDSAIRFECDDVGQISRSNSYGQFDCVLSLEVIEDCYSPAEFMAAVSALLKPNGLAIISTPYHGYLKNLALGVTGKMDAHFTALWEGGHIKFFSTDTLGQLATDHGLEVESFKRVGRIPALAKSMILFARKPAREKGAPSD